MVVAALFLEKKMEHYLLKTYRTMVFHSRKITTPVLPFYNLILLNLHHEEDTEEHRIQKGVKCSRKEAHTADHKSENELENIHHTVKLVSASPKGKKTPQNAQMNLPFSCLNN